MGGSTVQSGDDRGPTVNAVQVYATRLKRFGERFMKRQYTVTGLFVLLAVSVWFVDSVLDYYVFLGGSFTELSGREFALRAMASGSILVLGLIISMAFSADRRVRQEIAKRKQIESEREALLSSLQQAERLKSLAILAGGVAHDLNNTLVPLVSHAEMILLGLPEDSPLRRRVESMGKAAEDAGEIISDLMTLARRGRYDMKSTSLNAAITAYLDSPAFETLKEIHPYVQVDVSLTQSLGLINGSDTHLSKAVMNLIINAFDAMPDGGSLHITTSRQYLHQLLGGYSSIVAGDYQLLRVRDTGTGIGPDEIVKVFEPYYSSKTMAKSGTGLGLAVVYGVLMDHCGYYDILSEVGSGTEFVLYFPVISEDTTDVVAATPYAGKGETILVVDDLDDYREIASDVLASLGYSVITANGGREAIDIMRRNRAIDLVLLDMIMEPDLSGLDTFLEIIRMVPRQKVLIVSAYATNESVRRMQALGAGDFVQKPFNRETIGRAIRKQLELSSPSVTAGS
jgi:two-component system cell cycle sensor histidine kinase/response regulator CckA